jgi:hypothetical protein
MTAVTTTSIALASTPTPSCMSQGCYTEATKMRALSSSSFFDDSMIVEACAAACRGYTWFGVEHDREDYPQNSRISQ